MGGSATLPPEAADMLRPALPPLADEIIAAIAREVPDYERAMEGEFGQIVRLGVEVALNRFVDVLVGERSSETRARETYVSLGRGEYHAGRSLEALLGAYRVGARLCWRRFVEAGTGGGLAPEALYDLGEAIFEYIDELSAESAEGYAEEQSAAAGETQRRRRRLVRLLVQEPPPAQEAVRTAAQAAGWVLPRQLAAVVAAEGEAAPAASEEILDAIAARLARRLGAGAIGAAAGGLAVVILPDPDAPARRRGLTAALEDDQRAGLGPTVRWPEAPASLRRAVAAFRLPAVSAFGGADATSGAGATSGPGGAGGRRRRGGLIVAEDHLGSLLLTADLARTRLAPLATLAPGARARLVVTLRAWLDRPGQVQAVAAALGVHPQTVRYRLKQLRELFGNRLEEPEARFELALALRAAEGHPLLM